MSAPIKKVPLKDVLSDAILTALKTPSAGLQKLKTKVQGQVAQGQTFWATKQNKLPKSQREAFPLTALVSLFNEACQLAERKASKNRKGRVFKAIRSC